MAILQNRQRWIVIWLVQGIAAAALIVYGGPGGCISIQVSTSIEEGKEEQLDDIADDYSAEERVNGRCVDVDVKGTSSGIAREALGQGWEEYDFEAVAPPLEPEVWLPTSSMWLDLLDEGDEVEGLSRDNQIGSIAQSLLVIAMPDTMARVLGWPDQELTWDRMRQLSEDGWASEGHPEWGDFKFAKDNPLHSTSGLAATAATFDAAAQAVNDGEPGGLTVQDVSDSDVSNFVREVEAGAHNYEDDIITSLETLADYDADHNALAYLSAVLLQEQLVYDYNKGEYSPDDRAPNEPLRVFYPAGSALALDHPYVVLPSATADQEAVAEDFYSYLRRPERQQQLAEVGFRQGDNPLRPAPLDADVEAVLNGEAGAGAVEVRSLVLPPPGDVLQALLGVWDGIRKPANVLLVLDTSQSMTTELPDGATRLATMQTAVEEGLDVLLPEAHDVGLWSFPSTGENSPDDPLVDLEPFNEQHLETAIGDLSPGGGTPLYDTIAAAYQRLVEHNQDQGEERINAVVVLTDGGDEAGDENSVDYDLDALLGEVEANNLVAGQPTVQIFTIAFGGDAALGNLQEISDATSAESYDARDPSRPLDEVFLEVVDNF